MQAVETDQAPPRTDPRVEQFRAMYHAEFGFVWAAARRLGVPAAALEDAVQEVFITAYRRLDELHYEVSPRGWLYGVTRRVASRHRRGESRRIRRLAAFGEVAVGSTEPHARRDAARTLEALLGNLPQGTREVWELTELLGMSGPEIAGELGLPLNTVYSRLRLARAQLCAAAGAVEALTEAARREEQPPPEAARRSWALIVPALGREGPATLAAAWAGRAAMATTLVAAVAVAIAVARGPRRAQEVREGPVLDVAKDMTVRAGPVEQVPLAAAPAVAEAPRRAVVRPAPTDPLAAEVALIDRARAHLAADEPGAALAVLGVHAREFPRGALLDAREAARVEALCEDGRAAEAEAAARTLVAGLSGSPLARRFERYACEKKREGS
jgi:RNA polymerase sigma factor (sigma-70 family)